MQLLVQSKEAPNEGNADSREAPFCDSGAGRSGQIRRSLMKCGPNMFRVNLGVGCGIFFVFGGSMTLFPDVEVSWVRDD